MGLTIATILLIACGSTTDPDEVVNELEAPCTTVEACLAQMTLDEKIGQMTQVQHRALANESDIIPPYEAAIEKGVGSIMISYNSWNGTKLHASGFLINDLLKGELGFSGLVVSDWGAIDQIPGNYASDVRTSINAGIDMVMVPDNYLRFINTLRDEVNAGNISMDRIDDAVSRILAAKFDLGFFEQPFADRHGS